MLLISIPKPCHEDWNKMLPNKQGAFCNVCSKTVVDFTSLSDEEVKNYFLSNQRQKTCGRFKNTQLTDSDNLLPAVLAGNIPLWKKLLAIVVILFGSFLTGCKEQMLGKVAVPEESRIITTRTTGEIMVDSSSENDIPKEEYVTSIKGFTEIRIVPEVHILQGDIAIEPLPQIPDTILSVMPEMQKIDSTKKIASGKAYCDSLKPGSTNFTYYKP